MTPSGLNSKVKICMHVQTRRLQQISFSDAGVANDGETTTVFRQVTLCHLLG